MVTIVERPKWSFWKFREIYECGLPDHCVSPIEEIVRYYEDRGGEDWTITPDYAHCSRGSVWGSLFSPVERHQLQKVVIRIEPDPPSRRVVCEYRIFKPAALLHFSPWTLQREFEELDLCLSRKAEISRPVRRPGFFRTFLVNIPFRMLYRLYRIFSWLRYRAVRRFTPAGWLVAIALLAAAMMGVDTESTVAYQAFTPLLFLLILAMSFSFAFRTRFSATRRLPRFGSVGQSFTYGIALKNLSAKVQSDLTLLENLADPRPSFSEWKAVQLAAERRVLSLRKRPRTSLFKRAVVNSAAVPSVRPNEEVEVRVQMTPLRRGIIRFVGVAFARPDPFGLFRAFDRLALPQSMLILPRRYPLPLIALPGTMKYQEGGVAFAASVGQSDEFVALRDYRRGDPVRHIHWRSWAKTGKPIVKEFEDEFFVRHALVLDTFTSDPRGDVFEEAVSVAASFACTIPIQESLLDLLFVGTQAYCFTAGRGVADSDRMLEILASVTASSDQPFRALEHLVLDHASLVSGCICVFVAWDPERHSFIRKLQSMGLPLVVLVVVEAGQNRSLDPGPMRDQPDRFYVLETGRIEEGLSRLNV